jgi:hypothetical protein
MFERLLRGHELRAHPAHVLVGAGLEALPSFVCIWGGLMLAYGDSDAAQVAGGVAVLIGALVTGTGWLTFGVWRPVVALTVMRIWLGVAGAFAVLAGVFIAGFGEGAGVYITASIALLAGAALIVVNLLIPLWSAVMVLTTVRARGSREAPAAG